MNHALNQNHALNHKLALIGLAILTLLRLLVAGFAPLSPDEAYYWVWSRDLQPGYLDAPPMVALWIRAGTLIGGQGAIGIRLLGPLSAALGSILLFQAAEALLPNRNAGLTAAALLNATLLFGAGTVIMTPDTPLLFFWTCAIWTAARLVRTNQGWWLAAYGVFIGLALASKYTAVFLLIGLALWLILTPGLRGWIVRPPLWWGLLWGAQAFVPTFNWNREHGWASFIKQGGRIADFSPYNAFRFLAELIAGQLGLATPLIFVLCAGGVILAVRRAWRSQNPEWMLLVCLTVPAAALFLEHVLGDRVQANWPAILYPAAVIAACGLESRPWMRLRMPAIALGGVMTAIAYLQASAALFPLPARLDPTALRLVGWPGLASQIEAVQQHTNASFIAADDYGPASELARDLRVPVPVIGIEPRWALFSLPLPEITGQTGLLVRSEHRGPDLDRSRWADITPIAEAVRTRDNQVVERFRIYQVTARAGGTSMAVLPRL